MLKLYILRAGEYSNVFAETEKIRFSPLYTTLTAIYKSNVTNWRIAASPVRSVTAERTHLVPTRNPSLKLVLFSSLVNTEASVESTGK
jgi:hypothetical protein